MIGIFGDILNFASISCVAFISLISSSVSFSFNLSYFIGQMIVKFGIALFSFLVECLLTLGALIQVLTEDYLVFLSDISSTLSHLFKTVLDIGDCLYHAVWGICSNLEHGVLSSQNFVIFALNSFVNFVGSILGGIHYGLVLLKNSLVLVGLTSWDLFVFFPNQVVAFKKALVSFVVQCMANLRDAVNSVRGVLHYGFKEIVLFMSDIPRESLYGLFVCLLVSSVFVKYHRSIQPLLVRNVVYIFNQSQRTLFSAWTYLEAFTFWLLTNQMTPSLNGSRRLATGTGADLPVGGGNHTEAARNDEELYGPDEVLQGRTEHSVRKLLPEPENRLCVVCQDNDKCTIILPCRHVCLCYECCNLIKRTHGRCPICRHIVRMTMRVYI